METRKIWNSIVCYDDYSFEKNNELRSFLEPANIATIIDSIKKDVVIVLWWDGTMIRAIKENHSRSLPFLWINFWNKWYLLNEKEYVNDWSLYVEKKLQILKIFVNTKSGSKETIAVNEVDIRANSWRPVDILIEVTEYLRNLDSQSFISPLKFNKSLRWDWAIIYSWIWSTAYNKSLGWTIIRHNTDLIGITPKAPSNCPSTSILVPSHNLIEVKNVWRLNPMQINCDWEKIEDIPKWEEFSVEVKSYEEKITFLIPTSYLNIWSSRELEEQGFKTK